MIAATTWMDPNIIMMTERSQIQNSKNYTLSLFETPKVQIKFIMT